MEGEEILVRFADLRRAATAVPAYVKEALSVSEAVSLRSAIEDDFGVCGLDTESLLLNFGQQFRVDLTRYDFTGCISAETPEYSCLPVLVLLPLYLILVLLAWAANVVAAICWAPFSLPRARLMLKAGIGKPPSIVRTLLFPRYKPRPSEQILTIGDFAASAASGRFVKRERVRFVLAE